MAHYTFSDLLHIMESSGNVLAEVALGRMMDIVEEKTGEFPDWDSQAPDWVINKCFNRETIY